MASGKLSLTGKSSCLSSGLQRESNRRFGLQLTNTDLRGKESLAVTDTGPQEELVAAIRRMPLYCLVIHRTRGRLLVVVTPSGHKMSATENSLMFKNKILHVSTDLIQIFTRYSRCCVYYQEPLQIYNSQNLESKNIFSK